MGRIAVGLLILLAYLGAGTLVAHLTRVPVPPSVLGMLLLTLSLRLGVLPAARVRPAAELLIRHMALLFVPAGVGLMLYADLLREQWPALLLAGVGSTLAVLVTVGMLQRRLEANG